MDLEVQDHLLNVHRDHLKGPHQDLTGHLHHLKLLMTQMTHSTLIV